MYNTEDPNIQANTVTIDRGAETKCVVNLHGCTITSWRFENWELLFVSRHSLYDNKKNIVGGIRIAFPVIGDWLFGPKNGFAAVSRWELVKGPFRLKDSRDMQAVFRLVDNPFTRSFWNFNFEIVNVITLTEFTLQIETTIKNTSEVMPFRFHCLFPIYFQIPYINTLKIKGLKDCKYDDKIINDNETRTDRRKVLEIKEYLFRVYKNVPTPLELMHLHDDNQLKIWNTQLEDVMIWNPWDEHGTDVEDFRPDQYDDMICIGNGKVKESVHLGPQEEFKSLLKLHYITPDQYCDGLFY